MDLPRKCLWIGVAVTLGGIVGVAQFQRSGRDGESGPIVRGEGGIAINEDTVQTARETASHSTGTPNWANSPGFGSDVFTFARAIFKSGPNENQGFGRGWRLGWWVDYPDADLNFSYRLQQMTSMKVNPDGRVLKLTDSTLKDYPFLFMEHPGYMYLGDEEARALRDYLLNGGALLVIDFWSTREWDGFDAQMKRVLPGRTWVDLPLSHPVFHCVFDLSGPMRMLQVPTIQFWNSAHDPRDPESRIHRVDRGPGSDEMHVRAWLDDKRRIMAIAIHNSDISDGWEREGESDQYFHTFSERIAYPLGINLVVYLMTH